MDDEKDVYFDCVEYQEFDHNIHTLSLYKSVIQLPTPLHPWISELQFSIHRKTSVLRRLLNYFKRSKKHFLSNLIEQFIRVHAGYFSHPIGSRFHVSYANEKWLLILKKMKLVNYPTYPYPRTRIIIIRKGLSYIVR
ncbi:unnamed protein product [Rotaria socialis]|uniref:Uncharacterized protein n=1 Tax=Rotaria socialis TaxID=392032 RepID=A0A818WHA9_9BILA|nr:unnamed protein product [Rotaria socialis]CAF3726063.1 unnamed protein product [Rotaria socialis]CAF4518847.1 unnamed protein product [Rotaria socialis]CAF4803112.1 unnamed protein product [Rotaria socialis]